MLNYLMTIFLAVIPISEARGAIIYGLSTGANPAAVFLLAVITNILTIPFLFWILKHAHFRNLADRLFGNKMQDKIKQHERVLNKYGILGLLAFVAIPLPVTGAWTGAFVSEILKFNRKKSLLVISLGVIISGILVFFGFGGTMFLLNKYI